MLSAEQDSEASADAGGDERDDEDYGDELGVHSCCRPQTWLPSQVNEPVAETLLPSLVSPSKTVLSRCPTR